MAEVMIRAQFQDLMKETSIMEEIYAGKWAEAKPVYERVFNMPKTPSKKSVTDTGITKFTVWSRKPESQNTIFDRVFQGFDTKYTFLGYGSGYSYSHEMKSDEQYGILEKYPTWLFESGIRSLDILGADILNSGGSLNTLFLTGGDGKALFSTVHPYADGSGSTFSNDAANSADLSVTSIREHIINFERTKGDRDEYLDLQVKKIIVPWQERLELKEILGSPDRPDTAERAKNVLNDMGLEQIAWRQLSDADTWFLEAAQGQHALKAWMREKPGKLDSWLERRSKVSMFSDFMRVAFGHSDARGIYRVQGA